MIPLIGNDLCVLGLPTQTLTQPVELFGRPNVYSGITGADPSGMRSVFQFP